MAGVIEIRTLGELKLTVLANISAFELKMCKLDRITSILSQCKCMYDKPLRNLGRMRKLCGLYLSTWEIGMRWGGARDISSKIGLRLNPTCKDTCKGCTNYQSKNLSVNVFNAYF